ncbi:Pyoverdine/dityrosine biosynthesis protein-domain-containing protein [Hypoxylon sp. NC1633]|nr:Pyoverdine/dityrosine biosynthesis protein-domain-containing protein [Hypoxylon sp. NC1633]
MESVLKGESIFYRWKAVFAYDQEDNLLWCSGPQADRVKEEWTLCNRFQSVRTSKANKLETWITERFELGCYMHFMCLYRNPSSDVAIGVLSYVTDNVKVNKSFDEFFMKRIMPQIDLAMGSWQINSIPPEQYKPVTEKIVTLFDSYLRYQGADDKWIDYGRAYFADRVDHFTSKDLRLEFCLPAFPCKSSNTNKITGKDPDRGEQLALERLHGFVEAIEQVYDAGAKFWIISDGHVFSDCIGVDDQDVDSYGQKLIEMNHSIALQKGNPDRVGFKSLIDLFGLWTGSGEKPSWLPELTRNLQSITPPIDHHVETKKTLEAELCRCILMAGCQSQRSVLRERIESQDAATLALYRGFSRFMLEDLELHPLTQSMTRSKQKKLSSNVAFEMIMRNQAYSNLVELLFPNHIRLSIHAHNNAGPKFGIQLFDPATVRAVESLSPSGSLMTSRDLLHIPTPWHNSVVEIRGSKMLYVTKAKIAREAVAAGDMTGGLVGKPGVQNDRINQIDALYFSLCASSDSGAERKEEEVAKQEETPVEPQEPLISINGLESYVTQPASKN